MLAYRNRIYLQRKKTKFLKSFFFVKTKIFLNLRIKFKQKLNLLIIESITHQSFAFQI